MKSILTAILSFMVLAAGAQNDPAAKAILDKVSAKFKTLKTVQANYTLNVTNRSGKNAGKKSGLIYLKNTKFHITEKSLELTSDGKKMWKYEPAANEVTISDVDNSNQGITPQRLFTNFYDKDFIYKLNGTKIINGKKTSEIELTPTDKRKNFFKVYVYVDQAQSMIISSRIFENSGNIYEYSITNMKTNIPLDDAMFVFNKAKHPGVDEIQQ
jgi:chaperone LolA